MPKPTKGPRIGGTPSHERIIMANLASQLFEHGRITTTETRARRVQPLAEKLISKAKRGDLHARRLVNSTITDKAVVHVLFTEIAPKLAGREGGYTRITKIGNRKGDNAPMAIIEVITDDVTPKADKPAKTTEKPASKSAAKDEAEAATTTQVPDDVEATEGVVAAVADQQGEEVEAQTTQGADTDAKGDDVAQAANHDVKDYGENSYRGDQPPAGFDVKGNEDSMLYHTPESPAYKATKAEVWFNSAEAAEASGFSLSKTMQAKKDAAEAEQA